MVGILRQNYRAVCLKMQYTMSSHPLVLQQYKAPCNKHKHPHGDLSHHLPATKYNEEAAVVFFFFFPDQRFIFIHQEYLSWRAHPRFLTSIMHCRYA